MKKAPELPGVLDVGEGEKGVEALKNAEGKKNQNTIEIRLQPQGESGYMIDLEKGRLAFRGSDKNIALLKNIHHAVGHYEVNEKIIGNNDSNILNGAGGRDHILIQGGSDIIMIAEGIAEGGEGDGVYMILQSRHNADLVIKETPLTEEAREDAGKRASSVIKLMYRLSQIEACDILQNGDIVMQLRNENGTLTRMTLKEAYMEAKLHHNYILNTLDGFSQAHFPERSVNPLKFEVSYNPIKDALFQSRTQGMAPEDIKIIQNRSENSLTVGKSRILLPSFMRLYIKDTGINDILIGDETRDQFWGLNGNNVMKGQGREDIYAILPGAPYQEIDNHDSALNPSQDLLVLAFAAWSNFKIEGKDLIIYDDPQCSQ